MRLLHIDAGREMRGGQWQVLYLLERLAAAGHNITLLARLGSPLYEKAKEQLEKLTAEVKKGYAKVKAKVQEVDVKEVRDDVVDYVRRNPGKSILIALGVGFAVGYLVRRREP